MRNPVTLHYQGEFVPIDPKSTYTPTVPGDSALPRKVVRKINGNPILPGTYIGLQGVDWWRPGTDLPPVQRLGAAWVSKLSHGAIIRPLECDPTLPFVSWTPSTDVPQDFEIPFESRLIVKAPRWSAGLTFSVGDGLYGDNSAVGDFGIYLSFPNGVGFWDPEDHPSPANNSFFNATPFGAGEPEYCYYRAWYGEPTKKGYWSPSWSHYDGPRPSGPHKGMDIFCPRGTLLAPPCSARFYWKDLTSVKLGWTARFEFEHEAKQYSAIYAHCDSKLGGFNDGDWVDRFSFVARSGCSGNTITEHCGFDMKLGGRSDHVHVGLYEGWGWNFIKPAFVRDPQPVLGFGVIDPYA